MLKGIKKGFTLIELLIVIAIIGILAGVVIYSSAGASTKAKNTTDAANLDNAVKLAQQCLAAGEYLRPMTIYPAAGTSVCVKNSTGTLAPSTTITGSWPDSALFKNNLNKPSAMNINSGAIVSITIGSTGGIKCTATSCVAN
ncbi:MAG: type II secretion system protein [Candidatus Berkelbacteria bacterium]